MCGQNRVGTLSERLLKELRRKLKTVFFPQNLPAFEMGGVAVHQNAVNIKDHTGERFVFGHHGENTEAGKTNAPPCKAREEA